MNIANLLCGSLRDLCAPAVNRRFINANVRFTFSVCVLLFAMSVYAQQATPVLRLAGVDGKPFDLTEARGEVVLASFGATWCPPCRAELKALEKVKAEYKGKPVRFVWVSIESEAEASNSLLRRFAKDLKLTMPVLRDGTAQNYLQFSQRKRLPMVVVFDAAGRVAAPPTFGMSDEETYKTTVRAKLDTALRAQPSTAQAATNAQ